MKRFFVGLIFLISSNQTFSAPINLIWQCNHWEEDWLMELMAGVDAQVIDDRKFQQCMDRSIVIVSANHLKGCIPYFEKLKALNYTFGVILLSDERYQVPLQLFKDARFIFKNHWHQEHIKQKNILIFALGYKKGFWTNGTHEIPDVAHRSYTWSFAGQLTGKPTRQSMINIMKEIPNYSIYETHSFGDPKALPINEYRNLMLDSIFIPCPTGFINMDSFRVYEALECGCIPIVEKQPDDYFAHFFGDHPFLAIDSWEEAPALINALLSNPEELEQRRLQCMNWWKDYKTNLNRTWISIISNSLLN